MTAFKGKIKNFDVAKGFGFVTTDDGKSIYFHKSVVKTGNPIVGAPVEGDWETSDKGPRAKTMRVLAAVAVAPTIIKYYADAEKKIIRSELLCEEAETLAHELAGDKPTTSTQLRRFFGEVRHLERIVYAKGFDVARPLIRMLAAKSHYAFGRNKIGLCFQRYLSDNARAIQDQKDFEAFVKNFEAVVGYFTFLKPKDN